MSKCLKRKGGNPNVLGEFFKCLLEDFAFSPLTQWLQHEVAVTTAKAASEKWCHLSAQEIENSATDGCLSWTGWCSLYLFIYVKMETAVIWKSVTWKWSFKILLRPCSLGKEVQNNISLMWLKQDCPKMLPLFFLETSPPIWSFLMIFLPWVILHYPA